MKNLILLLFILSISFAQQKWIKIYGGIYTDIGYSVQQASDGGYIVAGYTSSFGAGGIDVYIIKTDSIGDTLWTRTYGGAYYEEGFSVQQTSDGGYIVTGWTNSFGVGYNDVYLIKTNTSGDTLWTRTYGGIDYDEGYSVRQTSDGGYIIAGRTCSFGDIDGDVYLIKTNTSGDTLWTRTYGGMYYDWGNSVQQTSDGGYIIAGFTISFGAGNGDVYLIKTNATGDTIWTRTYGWHAGDEGYSVQQTSDGGYIIAGYTHPFGVSSCEVYLIKTNASGDTLWTRTYGGMSDDYGYSVQQTLDGGYIIVGYTYSYGAGSVEIYLIKTDALGDTLWTKTYGGMDNDEGYSVQQTSDGGYIVAGFTESFGADYRDVCLIKTDANGNAAVEERKTRAQNIEVELKAVPNPFTSFTWIPGYEYEDFALFDITGSVVGKYKGSKIGENLSVGVYFVMSQNKSLNPLQIVKIK